MSKEECPKCLGIGEEVIFGRPRSCKLCNGNGEVESDIADAFISSIVPDFDGT